MSGLHHEPSDSMYRHFIIGCCVLKVNAVIKPLLQGRAEVSRRAKPCTECHESQGTTLVWPLKWLMLRGINEAPGYVGYAKKYSTGWWQVGVTGGGLGPFKTALHAATIAKMPKVILTYEPCPCNAPYLHTHYPCAMRHPFYAVHPWICRW